MKDVKKRLVPVLVIMLCLICMVFRPLLQIVKHTRQSMTNISKSAGRVRKEAYAKSHKTELDSFNKAYRTLKKHSVDLNVYLKALQKEYDDLKISHTDLKAQLVEINEELKAMKDICYWIGKVLSPEQTVEKQPEPKHSPTERIKYEREQNKKKQVQKAPKQKKHDMEL